MPRLPIGRPRPAADIDAVIAAYYAAFDNRGGRAPAIKGLPALFAVGASITRVATGQIDTWTLEAFIAPRAALLSDGALTGFHEWEVEGATTALGDIASRRSVYRKDGLLDGAPYEGGGRKFIQLARTGGRWLITSILWEDD